MAKASGGFQGFSVETFAFLSDLSRHNNKTWFDAHRGVYDAAVVEPAIEFVKAMGATLQTMVPGVLTEPRIGGSIFRIYRDTRFSKDKTPYKTHVGIRFRDKDAAKSPKCTGPVFYVEFDAKNLRLGAGVKAFEAAALAAYRRAVTEPATAQKIGAIVRRAEANGHDILGGRLSRVPAAYANQAGNELLRRTGLFILESSPLPSQIYLGSFVDFCGRWFAPYAPLFSILRKISAAGFTK